MANSNIQKMTLGDLFYSNATLYAKRIAVEEKKGDIYVGHSYKRLFDRAARLGAVLSSRLERSSRVMIVGKNSVEWLVSYIAVTCFVGAAVPLPDTASEETAKNAAELCEISAVLYGDSAKNLADAAGEGLLKIAFSEIDELSKNEKKVVRPRMKEDDPAELAYTYGSDERAKAVVLTHKNICFTIAQMAQMNPLTEEDKLYSVLPLAYSFERISGALYPLSCGACLTYGEGLLHLSTNLRRVRPTAMLCVPLILDRIYGKIWANIEKKGLGEKVRRAIKLTEAAGPLRSAVRRQLFAEIHDSLGGRLSVLICGGGTGSPEAVYGLREFGIRALCCYGMTEAPLIAANRRDLHEYSSVGLPVPEGLVDIYNMHSDGIGEIRYKGDNVMPGYYKNPEKTDEMIVGGWLYTGDMGYFDRRGFLHIVGKKSNVIVTAKNRWVFPEEIEGLLCENPFIAEAVILGVENKKRGDHDIVAAVYPNFENLAELYGGDMTHAQLRGELKNAIDAVNSRLDSYKRVVRFVVFENEFEKNEVGKILRSAVVIE